MCLIAQIAVKSAAKKIKKADAIYVSPFARALETAEILAESLGLDKKSIKIDERLMELNFGDFNGKPFSEYLEYDEKQIHI